MCGGGQRSRSDVTPLPTLTEEGQAGCEGGQCDGDQLAHTVPEQQVEAGHQLGHQQGAQVTGLGGEQELEHLLRGGRVGRGERWAVRGEQASVWKKGEQRVGGPALNTSVEALSGGLPLPSPSPLPTWTEAPSSGTPSPLPPPPSLPGRRPPHPAPHQSPRSHPSCRSHSPEPH